MFGLFRTGFDKIKSALSKTRSLISGKIKSLFNQKWDEETLEKLERILYEADLGSVCAHEFTEEVRKFLAKHPEPGEEAITNALYEHALKLLSEKTTIAEIAPLDGEPRIILIVGVNGGGKTTTIAKLANHYKKEGKSVLLVGADTFRAAATEQLDIWATRAGVDIVKGTMGADPSAVIFDGLTAAKARGAQCVLIDTSGRLQNKSELMRELEKMKTVIKKVYPSAPHETLLIVDATTGQNGKDQAQIFNQYTPLTGIVLTKLDGSAKGGIALAIKKELSIPIKWTGVGEKIDDILPFDPNSYAQALFEK